MKISELVKRTNVPKETIHYYIREGLLRKPRKTSRNVVNYNEGYVDQIRIIKGLQDNYYMPLSVVKKFLRQLKKQSPSKQSAMQLLSEHFRPIDHLIAKDVKGKEAFLAATGLGEKWLCKMEEWGIISSKMRKGQPVYSSNDVAIGKLLVDMDRLGFGPRDGYDPKLLKRYADFFSECIAKSSEVYFNNNSDKLFSENFAEKGARYSEIMGLFFYYLYRKLVQGDFTRYFESSEKEPGENH